MNSLVKNGMFFIALNFLVVGITASERMLDLYADQLPFDKDEEELGSMRGPNPSPANSATEEAEESEDEEAVFFARMGDNDVFGDDETEIVAAIWELLKTGNNINIRCAKYFSTPLHFAAAAGNEALVAALLGAGASQCFQDRLGNTPLHLAVLHGKIGVVRRLLRTANQFVLMHRNRQGKKAFQIASDTGNVKIAGLLSYHARSKSI